MRAPTKDGTASADGRRRVERRSARESAAKRRIGRRARASTSAPSEPRGERRRLRRETAAARRGGSAEVVRRAVAATAEPAEPTSRSKAERPSPRGRTEAASHEPRRTKPRRIASADRGSTTDDDDEPEVTTLGGGIGGNGAARAAPRGGEDEGEPVEQIGGDAMDETPRRAPRLRRQYKIQEVIKRRQVMLVQVVKEERGNKGAALTTYLSLAGRYSVLMPNTARGGGISRKITNAPGPQPAEGDRRGARSSRGHGRHPAHRRRLAHQGRGQARFRISAADVGDRARDDAHLQRADARLRGGLADQARDPRPLQQGGRRNRRRRRSGLSARRGTSCAC